MYTGFLCGKVTRHGVRMLLIQRQETKDEHAREEIPTHAHYFLLHLVKAAGHQLHIRYQ